MKMRKPPLQIHECNLSYAWARAFLAACDPGVEAIVPLTVNIELHDGLFGGDVEDPCIRQAVDGFLAGYAEKGVRPCQTTANLIFPSSYWNPDAERDTLYARYRRNWPQIKKYNPYGTYFQRMIAHGSRSDEDEGFNQLEYVISTYKDHKNHRTSALQAHIAEPLRDHTHQRMRGFPCLQQVNFVPLTHDKLCIVGNYATQYIADRAYGNYLGLKALGEFVAHELEMELVRITCFAPYVKLGEPTKSEARSFASKLRSLLPKDRVQHHNE